jgi:hypothetical protein
VGHPSVAARPHSTRVCPAAPVPAANASTADDFRRRASSSDDSELLSSVESHGKRSGSTPPTPLSAEGVSLGANGLGDAVERYDWASHWARREAPTEVQKDALPPAEDPRQCPANVATPPPVAKPSPVAKPPPQAETKPRDPCPAVPNLGSAAAPKSNKPSSSTRREGKARPSEQARPKEARSNTAVTARSVANAEAEMTLTPTSREVGGFDFAFGGSPSPSTPRPSSSSMRTQGGYSKAESRRRRQR